MEPCNYCDELRIVMLNSEESGPCPKCRPSVPEETSKCTACERPNALGARECMSCRCGPVTHDEAREIASRYNASHWRKHIDGKEYARYSIPADPTRDDDLRLGAYITQRQRVEEAALEALDRAWLYRCEAYEPWPEGEGERDAADVTAEHVYKLLREALVLHFGGKP